VDNELQNKIHQTLKKYRHARFIHNGRSLEEGLDCLGFLILFFKDFGIDLPSDDGKPIEKDWYKYDSERYIRGIKSLNCKEIDIDSLKPLDLVYFVINHDVITHSGVMINEKEFAHMSPRRGLIISRLERHWRRRFRGAVRLIEE